MGGNHQLDLFSWWFFNLFSPWDSSPPIWNEVLFWFTFSKHLFFSEANPRYPSHLFYVWLQCIASWVSRWLIRSLDTYKGSMVKVMNLRWFYTGWIRRPVALCFAPRTRKLLEFVGIDGMMMLVERSTWRLPYRKGLVNRGVGWVYLPPQKKLTWLTMENQTWMKM